MTSYPMPRIDMPDWALKILEVPPAPVKIPVSRPSNEAIQHKIENARLVAQALEFLLKVWPEIPGASVTLTPANQDELKQIILALPAAVAL